MDDLELACHLSDRAAEVALQHFRAGVTATAKADGSPVTEADREVERLLREALAELRPDDALLGEEYGGAGDSDRVWVLDPIDGTVQFSARDPHWRIHVVLQVGGRPEVAVVTGPALGVRWWATRGGGAFESPWPARGGSRRLAVSSTAVADDAAVDVLSRPEDELPPPFRAPSSPLPLVELVRGEVDGVLAEGWAAWDHAPWILLVQEAGGRYTDPRGGAAADRGGLYSNAALHDQLLTMLGYPRPQEAP